MKMNPYNMPQIIKETSDGYFHLSVLDDLLSQREIYCLGEIDADSAGSLILQLQYLAAQDPEAEITLYINSPGGSVADGLALYDIMQTIPCPIRTVCMGTAASFGALLFTAGDTREIFPHSKINDPRSSDRRSGADRKRNASAYKNRFPHGNQTDTWRTSGPAHRQNTGGNLRKNSSRYLVYCLRSSRLRPGRHDH